MKTETTIESPAIPPLPPATGSADGPDFISELRDLLNRRSMENASNTPDFILAQYLTNCLRAWNQATQQRETWYGRNAAPAAAQTPAWLLAVVILLMPPPAMSAEMTLETAAPMPLFLPPARK